MLWVSAVESPAIIQLDPNRPDNLKLIKDVCGRIEAVEVRGAEDLNTQCGELADIARFAGQPGVGKSEEFQRAVGTVASQLDRFYPGRRAASGWHVVRTFLILQQAGLKPVVRAGPIAPVIYLNCGSDGFKWLTAPDIAIPTGLLDEDLDRMLLAGSHSGGKTGVVQLPPPGGGGAGPPVDLLVAIDNIKEFVQWLDGARQVVEQADRISKQADRDSTLRQLLKMQANTATNQGLTHRLFCDVSGHRIGMVVSHGKVYVQVSYPEARPTQGSEPAGSAAGTAGGRTGGGVAPPGKPKPRELPVILPVPPPARTTRSAGGNSPAHTTRSTGGNTPGQTSQSAGGNTPGQNVASRMAIHRGREKPSAGCRRGAFGESRCRRDHCAGWFGFL